MSVDQLSDLVTQLTIADHQQTPEGGAPTPQGIVGAMITAITAASDAERQLLYQLLGVGGSQPAPSGATLRPFTEPPAPQGDVKRKPLKWPVWSGAADDFYYYYDRLVAKYNIDGPSGYIGSADVAWYEIFHTLPSDKQQQVHQFWASGGPGGARNPVDFFQHLEYSFGQVQVKEQAQRVTGRAYEHG